MNDDDAMGIFTEAQRSYTPDTEADEVSQEVKILSAPFYTPEWNVFATLSDEQIAAWNSTQTLDESKSGDELKVQLLAQRKAADFISGFKQTVLLAMQEREKHGTN